MIFFSFSSRRTNLVNEIENDRQTVIKITLLLPDVFQRFPFGLKCSGILQENVFNFHREEMF